MHILAAVLLSVAAQSVPLTLERLELNLRVDYEHERVAGIARLTVRNASTGPVATVPLLLGRLMVVQNAGGLPFEQDVVTFEDETMRQVDYVTIHLPQPLAARAATTLNIDYGGHIVGYTETGNLYVHDRVAEDFTIIREDAYAFPVLGVPSRAVNRKIPRGDFTFDAQVTVPRGYVVAAGALVGQKDNDGTTTFHFATDMPAGFLNLPIAKYGVLDDKGVRVYYLPEDQAGAKLTMEKTQAALALLTKWFGPLGKEAKLSIIEIPEGWGSQAGLIPGIILEADSFKNPKTLPALYHELAHLWNANELEKPSARLNEGQSMWLQWVMAEELDAFKPEMLTKYHERMMGRLAREPRLATIPLHEYGQNDMTDWSYVVGYFYFKVLERVIGRDALLGVLRDYYQTHRQDGATLDQFTSLLEQRFPKAKAIDADWIRSTEWLKKLQSAKSLDAVASQY